jgi:hypothetical protein
MSLAHSLLALQDSQTTASPCSPISLAAVYASVRDVAIWSVLLRVPGRSSLDRLAAGSFPHTSAVWAFQAPCAAKRFKKASK